MMLKKLSTAASALGLCTALLFPSQSVAQSESRVPDAWPARSIRYVIPFPPGGPGDILGRSYAQKMAEGLGKPVIVENKSGGNTVIGADAVAKVKAGADVVQIYTGLIYRGPELITEVAQALQANRR